MNLWCMTIWRAFAAITSIHGLHYTSKSYPRKNYSRFVWIMIVCFSLSLCLWQTEICIRQYLKFENRTTTSFENGINVPYSAVTIWDTYSFKRTVIGRSALTKLLTATFLGGDSAGIKSLYNQIDKTCSYKPPFHDHIDEQISHFDTNTLNKASSDELLDILDFATKNKSNIFAKCYMKNKIPTDCESIVLSTLLDNGKAYAVNLHSNIAQNFLGSESGLGSVNKNYVGTNDTLFLSAGIENGLKLILNANQDENCGYYTEQWKGAGLHVVIHDSRTLPSINFGTPIHLKPGYEFKIVVTPRFRIRYTADLGYCREKYQLYMFPENTIYLKELCLMQCEAEGLWFYCRCTISPLKVAVKHFAKAHNISDEDIHLACTGDKRSCLMNLPLGYERSMDARCPHCKPPCQETEYVSQVTVTKFPPKHLVAFYKHELHVADEKTVAGNFLTLTVYFDSSPIEIVVEEQKFTLKDLFIYIGGSVGLFLGMSFMTFAELLQLFADTMHFVWKQFFHKRFKPLTQTSKATLKVKKRLRHRKINGIIPIKHDKSTSPRIRVSLSLDRLGSL